MVSVPSSLSPCQPPRCSGKSQQALIHLWGLVFLPGMFFFQLLASATPYSPFKSLLKYHFLRDTVPYPHQN